MNPGYTPSFYYNGYSPAFYTAAPVNPALDPYKQTLCAYPTYSYPLTGYYTTAMPSSYPYPGPQGTQYYQQATGMIHPQQLLSENQMKAEAANGAPANYMTGPIGGKPGEVYNSPQGPIPLQTWW